MNIRRWENLFLIAVLLILLTAVLVLAPAAFAQESGCGADMEETPPFMTLSQGTWAEGGFNPNEMHRIFFSMQERAAWKRRGTWLSWLERYAHGLHGKKARSRFALSLPDRDLEEDEWEFGWNHVSNKLWAKLRVYSKRLIAGEIRNPCGKSIGWAGEMDGVPEGTLPVNCILKTRNTHYRMMR